MQVKHGWWWHLLHDPIRDNPWGFLAVLLVFAVTGAVFWYQPWRLLRPKRWGVRIVGQESGNITDLPFLRFRTKAEADGWATENNITRSRELSAELTRYETYRLT